jgi:hypothetical protein
VSHWSRYNVPRFIQRNILRRMRNCSSIRERFE